MKKPGEACTGVRDTLAPFTEEAAVGRQLLALRSQEGHSRFMLLPGKPEETFGGPGAQWDSVDAAASGVELLELRVLAAEVFVAGPCEHAPDARSSGGGPVQRAAKVCFRRRPCTAASQQGCVVVAPYMEFEAVCRALDRWRAVLPSSLRGAPPSGKDDGDGAWHTSYLPLPPQDIGLDELELLAISESPSVGLALPPVEL